MAPLPNTIENPKKPWGRTDTGAIVDGFVGLSSPPNIVHGVDLSSNNSIKDYGQYSRCGAKFAFLRMDKAFSHHKEALAKEQWTLIPYVFMAIPPAMLNRTNYSGLHPGDSDAIEKNLQKFSDIGKASADKLTQDLADVGLQDIPKVSFAGLSGRLIALDVEQKLTIEKDKNANLYYGRFYARSICSWIQTTKARYPDAVVLIYSTPSVFGDYLNSAYHQDDNCLRGVPIWMARTTKDGGDLVGVIGSKDVNDLYAQRTCLQTAGIDASFTNTHIVELWAMYFLSMIQTPPMWTLTVCFK